MRERERWTSGRETERRIERHRGREGRNREREMNERKRDRDRESRRKERLVLLRIVNDEHVNFTLFFLPCDGFNFQW